MTQWFEHNGIGLHWREDGNLDGPAVLFLNSLGTDLRLWDQVVDAFGDCRLIRMDNRGHGLSDAPDGAYSIEGLTEDAAALMNHLDLAKLTLVGVSVGGMIAQGLAAKLPERVARVVLSNTAPQMGTPEMWQQRIDAVAGGGIASIAAAVLDRWFTPSFRNGPQIGLWQNMLTCTPVQGYIGVCAAIAGAELTDVTRQISCPALVVAGADDMASPPAIVEPLADLIPNARYVLIEGAGHLPMVDAAPQFIEALRDFMSTANAPKGETT